MSDDRSKEFHSKRLHQKHNYVKKQSQIAKAFNMPVDEPHRLQDHAALNCGIPGCVFCSNPRKIWKEKTVKEKSFEQTTNWIEE